MSDVSLKRIKQIRQKTSEGYTPIPIGTRGLLVDMLSELDLEEELKLGGNHYVTVYDTSTSTQISEWYFSEPRRQRDLEQMSNYVTYSLSISIISALEHYLIIEHEEQQEDEVFIVHGGQEDHIVERQDVPSDQQRIEITLYKGDFDRMLHKKIIYITTDTETGQVSIDEQVDYEISTTPEQEGE